MPAPPAAGTAEPYATAYAHVERARKQLEAAKAAQAASESLALAAVAAETLPAHARPSATTAVLRGLGSAASAGTIIVERPGTKRGRGDDGGEGGAGAAVAQAPAAPPKAAACIACQPGICRRSNNSKNR